MLATIDFDYQTLIRAIKINDIFADGMLPPEFIPELTVF